MGKHKVEISFHLKFSKMFFTYVIITHLYISPPLTYRKLYTYNEYFIITDFPSKVGPNIYNIGTSHYVLGPQNRDNKYDIDPPADTM